MMYDGETLGDLVNRSQWALDDFRTKRNRAEINRAPGSGADALATEMRIRWMVADVKRANRHRAKRPETISTAPISPLVAHLAAPSSRLGKSDVMGRSRSSSTGGAGSAFETVQASRLRWWNSFPNGFVW